MTGARVKQLSREELEELIAYYEDVLGVRENVERVAQLRQAFRLPAGPAWLLSRLVAADGRLFRRDALIDHLPANDSSLDRNEKIIDVYMVRIRKALGADGVETVWGVGWRLTPAGRQRVRAVLEQAEAA